MRRPRYPEEVQKIRESGKTSAGMRVPIMVAEDSERLEPLHRIDGRGPAPCNPMAMIVEQAGGKAVTRIANGGNILDVEPISIHQRTSVVIGSRDEVDAVVKLLATHPDDFARRQLCKSLFNSHQ